MSKSLAGFSKVSSTGKLTLPKRTYQALSKNMPNMIIFTQSREGKVMLRSGCDVLQKIGNDFEWPEKGERKADLITALEEVLSEKVLGYSKTTMTTIKSSVAQVRYPTQITVALDIEPGEQVAYLQNAKGEIVLESMCNIIEDALKYRALELDNDSSMTRI